MEVTRTEQIEGVPVLSTYQAETIDDAAQFLRGCAADKAAVFPAGGRTALDYGLPPARSGALLDTTKLTQVVDYPHEDMTITVQTGIRLAELNRILSEKGQELPIDVPDPETATLGGAMAVDANGPRRYAYGKLRDYVLGIDVLGPDGTRIHGGGRVVKNVAGYDFMKLHTGALGTLGVIAQATLKVKPIAATRAAAVVPLALETFEQTLERLNRSDTRPVAVEVLNANALADFPELEVSTPYALVVLYEESSEAVQWQIGRVMQEMADLGGEPARELPRESCQALLARLSQWPRQTQGAALFKANLLPGRVAAFCQLIDKQIPDAALKAHAGNGVVWVCVSPQTTWVQIGRSPISRFTEDGVGNVVIARCPTEWKKDAPVWGTPRPDWTLMRKIKQRLDPDDILNPGRFVFESPVVA